MKSQNIIKIPVSKEKNVDLVKLDVAIGKTMGWKRHKSETDKNCYSGLNFIRSCVYEDGNLCNAIEIVWTQDGINGFPVGDPKSGILDLPKSDLKKIKAEVEKHNG